VLVFTTHATAKPSQSDVFKSIQENVGQSDESTMRAAPWVCAGIAVIFLLALISKRQTRQAIPKPLNNPNKLMKEIMNSLPLRPKELKQLKVVADEISDPDADTSMNPLVLLLCPSLVIKVLREESTRADRRTLVTTLKKLGIR
jgi:hypothetical protein